MDAQRRGHRAGDKVESGVIEQLIFILAAILTWFIPPGKYIQETVEVARRDTLEKESLHIKNIDQKILNLLDQIQHNLYQKAVDFRNLNTHKIDTWDDFLVQIEKGGFLLAHWDGTPETEQIIKEETKATIRLIPIEENPKEGTCIYSGKPSRQRVYFARAY